MRQTDYYTNAARYLGLLDKRKDGAMPVYGLSEKGRQILHLGYKQRQLAFCDCILSHKVFADAPQKYFDDGHIPPKKEIVKIMKESNLYNIDSKDTFERRSSTITGWLNWIVKLTKE